MVNPSPEPVSNRISAILAGISKTQGEFHISRFVNSDSPYRNNITTALVNRGLIKSVRKGYYVTGDFILNDALIDLVIKDCKEQTRTSKQNSRNASKGKTPIVPEPKSEQHETKVVEKIVERPVIVNPFGFDFFSEILITNGIIQIGDYILEGTFTIKRKAK